MIEIKNRLVAAMYEDTKSCLKYVIEIGHSDTFDTITNEMSKIIADLVYGNSVYAYKCTYTKSSEEAFLTLLGRLLGIIAAENDCRPEGAKENLEFAIVHDMLKRYKIREAYGLFSVPFLGNMVENHFGKARTFVISFAEAYLVAFGEIARERRVKFERIELARAIKLNEKFFFGKEDHFSLEISYPSYRYYKLFGKEIKKVSVKHLNKGLYKKMKKAY